MENSHTTSLEIAVIGMAGRFPGAQNLQAFWNNLKNGVESISFFSHQELEEEGVAPEALANPAYVKAGGYLTGAEYFDPAFFKYTPLEARAMDPQLRIYHECTWAALEDAGCNPEIYPGLIGVYSGASPNPSWLIELLKQLKNPSQQFDVFNLNSSASFGTRISYNFNLKGPSFALQTACSTSLVAVHVACQGLLNAECDLALAGGVAFYPRRESGYVYQEGMINSPDGHCRAFDARARGTIRGEGVGVVVLKRLQEAVQDGDFIYAVIKGTAINNDGSRKIGYTAPSIDGQADAVKAALEVAEVNPESISYIETHGTGTAIGDPIEIAGLRLVFRKKKRASCALGSVKSNIGHCDNAGGVAGFIKTVLALHHRVIPPSLHFETPNPEIDFENSPFYVNIEKKEWHSKGTPRRAGVSSFGIGGTNAHVILEEYKSEIRISKHETNSNDQNANAKNKTHTPKVFGGLSSTRKLILLSAHTRPVLDKMTENLREFFTRNPGINLADAVYTLQTGRKTFKYRAFTTCASIAEAVENLSSGETGKLQIQSSTENNRPVILMFPGQGSQYLNMGWGLYGSEPLCREEMDRCFEILKSVTGLDLKEILYPHPSTHEHPASGGQGALFEKTAPKHGRTQCIHPNFTPYVVRNSPSKTFEADINRTAIAQPAIFILQYAVARLLLKWGIKPTAMIGHSIGEYTAACLSGVFSLEDALKLVALRGKLMQQMPPGDMLSVTLPEAELLPLLNDELALAAVNGPSNCVVSGRKEAVAVFDRQLREKGCKTRLLVTSHAFHSEMMDPILDSFSAEVGRISLDKPRLPFISNVSGTWISDTEAVDPAYWTTHLRRTVRFDAGLSRLLAEEPKAVFVEVGPGRVLSTLTRQHPRKKPEQSTLYLVRHPREKAPDDRFLLEKAGRLWQKGVHLDWRVFYAGEKRLRLPLPTYPFERQYFAVKRDSKEEWETNTFETAQEPAKTADMNRWFYVPSWKGVRLPNQRKVRLSETGCWLVLTDEYGIGSVLVERLKEERQQVLIVNRGPAFKKEGENTFAINPGQEEDFTALFQSLSEQNALPGRIIHLWNVTGPDGGSPLKQVEEYVEQGFYSLLYLPRAMGRLKMKQPVRIEVVSTRLQGVVEDDTVDPLKAVLLGPVRVIPFEYPHISCRSIDIELPQDGCSRVVEDLLFEFTTRPGEPVTALRGRSCWVQDFEPIHVESKDTKSLPVKPGGVYLLTGGLGGMGLTLAAGLAKNRQVRLVLIDRLEFPPAEEWPRWLDGSKHDSADLTVAKISSLRQMEKKGAEIMVCHADVTDFEQMRTVISQAKGRFGTIDGVIHTAGLADGGLIQVRSRQQSETVLAAKVSGTLVLDTLLAGESLDFFVVCSSLSSVLASPGQVAYCAANSFLDSYALQKAAAGETTLAINWDTWQGVGMAVAAVEKSAKARPVAHPLLDVCIAENPGRVLYISRLSADRFWVLDEHRISGKATLPGTAYIEILGAAFGDHTSSSIFEIEELYLFSPLIAADDEQKILHTVLEKEDGYFRFSMKSKSSGGGSSWQEHARGRVSVLKESEKKRPTLDLRKIAARCDSREAAAPAVKNSDRQEYLKVGRRWDNLTNLRRGRDQGLAEIELPADFVSDLNSYHLHPALMDTATAFLAAQYGEDGPYLPFLFKGLRVRGALPRKVFSYSYLKSESNVGASAGQYLTFQITITDETGQPCAEVEEFTLLKVSPESARQRFAGPVDETEFRAAYGSDPLKDGILPAEGVEVLHRLLIGVPPQVLVSTSDFKKRLHLHRMRMSSLNPVTSAKDRSGETAHPRPEISSEYAAPENHTQQKLAEIWQQFLGFGGIGVLDDFFELGGDSLKGLSVISEIHKTFHVELSIADLFSSPTIKDLAASIGSSSETIYSSIAPVEDRRYYPLSSAQRRLLFLQQTRPESVFYNIPGILMVVGNLDRSRLDVLEEVFRTLIIRHGSLRTGFHLIDEQPVQKIHAPGEVEFTIGYRSAEPGEVDDAEDEEAGRYRRIIKRFVRPFDLTRPPLMRVEVVRIEEQKYLWLFDIHHIVSDATGYAILHRDMFRLYRGEELEPLRIQYQDFSQWQNHLFASGRIEKQRDYWLQVYSDGVPKLNLPTDYPRPKVSRFKGEMFLFRLSREESRAFLETGSAPGATLFMNLLAVMNILLSRYTGSHDIVIGSTHVGRPHADLRNIVGMFVNLLALRSRPQPGLSYSEFLQQVKDTTLKAFENQDMQFEMLIEELDIKKDSTRNPLFDICINVQNYEQTTIEVEGLTFHPAGYRYRNAKFDMLLWANREAEEIHFMLEYSTELFKPETAREFSEHLQEIIRQVGRDKAIKLADIELSSGVVSPVAQTPDMDFDF
jgi:acyl transferase domain-containing protein